MIIASFSTPYRFPVTVPTMIKRSSRIFRGIFIFRNFWATLLKLSSEIDRT